jgi:SAM-dependent methyltransferase
MKAAAELSGGLACPRCAGGLADADGGFACARCGARFPVFGGIPCLVDDPALWRALWLRRLDDYSTSVEMRIGMLRQEAEAADQADSREGPVLLPRTRRRLRRIADGFAAQLDQVSALCEPLESGADPFGSVAIPNRPEPGQPAILECYEHLFRDWSWGTREHELALGFVAPLVPEKLGRVAVFGAGTGRLAADLHASRSLGRTFALDVNPLPFLVTARLLAGETVTLPEFPIDPNSEEVVVVDRALSAPARGRAGFSLVYADALRPPFPPGSLDAVVTSWFIDAARVDVRKIAAVINRVLRPGGLWVNLGPLRFHAVLSRAYTIEEVMDIVAGGGFEVLSQDRQDLPYFHSPVSGSRRTDLVFRFAARKAAEAGEVDLPESVPPWVANPLLPIPITPSLVALGKTSMFTTGVLAMIDGQRSIVDVARELGAAWNVAPARLQDELRAFLAQLPAA